MEQYRVLERLGKGAQGSVYLVENRIEGKKYVLKKVECKDEGEANDAFREAKALRELHHPYICGFKEFFVHWDTEDSAIYFCMIIEHYPKGDLWTVLRMKRQKREAVDESLVRKWLGQVLEALRYVHRKGIVHRDLKPSNLLLTQSMDVCLCDFGVATVMRDAKSNTRADVGTLIYLSPELVTRGYSEKSDLWALGCVLLEMVTCSVLDHQQMNLTLAEMRSSDSLGLDLLLQDIGQIYNMELVSILQMLLRTDPDQRPSVLKLLSVPFVRECVENVNTEIIDKKKKQNSAGLTRKALPREKGLAPVLEHLRSVVDNPDKVQETLGYVAQLVGEEGGHTRIDALGKLLVSEAMATHVTDAASQVSGLAIMNRLIAEANPGDVLFSEEVVSVIPKILKAHSDNPEILEAAANLLCGLSADESAAELVGAQGGIEHLLNTLKTYSNNSGLCAAACNAIWSLAVFECNTRILSDLCGLEVVCEVLRSHMTTSEVVESTAACLLSLSMEDDSLGRIGDLDTVTLLVRAVESHTSSAKVVKNSCLALASFVELDEESAFKVLACENGRGEEVSGLPILLSAYSVHKDNAEVVEAVCTLLMELAAYEEVKAEMNYLKFGQTMLAEVQKRFKENKDVTGPCESTLAALSSGKQGSKLSVTSLTAPGESTQRQ